MHYAFYSGLQMTSGLHFLKYYALLSKQFLQLFQKGLRFWEKWRKEVKNQHFASVFDRRYASRETLGERVFEGLPMGDFKKFKVFLETIQPGLVYSSLIAILTSGRCPNVASKLALCICKVLSFKLKFHSVIFYNS